MPLYLFNILNGNMHEQTMKPEEKYREIFALGNI